MRRCRECEIDKPVAAFRKRRACRVCRSCNNLKVRARIARIELARYWLPKKTVVRVKLTVQSFCVECGQSFTATRPALYHSDACKHRAYYRARRKLANTYDYRLEKQAA